MLKNEELPVMGVPYYAGHTHNPYRRGKGVLIQQVIYGFTPAPFNCFYCSNSGLTLVPRQVLSTTLFCCLWFVFQFFWIIDLELCFGMDSVFASISTGSLVYARLGFYLLLLISFNDFKKYSCFPLPN